MANKKGIKNLAAKKEAGETTDNFCLFSYHDNS